MIIDSLNEYIDILAGHIYDNDKVVTYKWLSKELEVHVNVAKQILWEFVKKHEKEKDIVSTHLLMGTLSGGSIHVEVVKDENLSSAKEKYSNVIAEHIYSLQKTLPDIELLAISGEGDVKFSSIRSKECSQRTDEELHVLRWGSGMSSEVPKPSIIKPTVSAEKEVVKKEETVSTVKKSVVQQKKGFDSLFGKAKAKVNEKHSPPKEADAKPKHSKNAQASPKKKTQGDMNSFWGPNKAGTSSSKETDTTPIVQKEKQENKPSTETKKPSPETKKPSTEIKKETKPVSRGKKRTRSKESASSKPKRKRIIQDSDSSESDASPEEEVEELPSSPKKSPPKARSPSPPKVKVENGKRKVLKLVDKTFEEDGFLVTKKVHVYESCSEEEPEVIPVKKSPPNIKGKKSTKQTTLMNFFKKP